MQLQRDDIIIRKGIVHILDSYNGYLGLSKNLLGERAYLPVDGRR